jgi:Family of unknown function (DUF6483)
MRKSYDKPLLTEDYLIRMINMVLAALARLVGLKTAGQLDSASDLIDESFEQIFGMRADLVRRLDDRVLLANLTYRGRLDADRTTLVADLFRAEGDILSARGVPIQAYWSHLRALNFYLEVSLNGDAAMLPPPDEKILELCEILDGYTLPMDTVYLLYTYFDRKAAYGRAEYWLQKLIRETGGQKDVLEDAIGFYQRMAGLPDAELETGGITREQIETDRARLDAMMA